MKFVAALLVLGLVLVLPLAAAKTLADFEDPYSGSPEKDGVATFTVTEEEAGRTWGLAYRNHPRMGFSVSILAANGTTMFEKVGSRNTAPLPPLEAGDYRFVIGRAPGAFQVLDQESANLARRGDITTELTGKADAFIASFPEWRSVNISGAVGIELFDLTSDGPREMQPGVPFLLEAGDIALITLHGAPGAHYTITSVVTDAPPKADTPGPGLWLVLAAASIGVHARRRRG